MNARLLARAAVVGTSLMMGLNSPGCKSRPPVHTDNAASSRVPLAKPVAASTPAAVVPQANAQGPVSPLPDTLAQKTTEYAKKLEPTAAAKATRRPGSGVPSGVNWEDPKSSTVLEKASAASAPPAAANSAAQLPAAALARSSAGPSRLADAELAAAVIASTSDAKHAASVARSASAGTLNDVPAILPEASDFGSGTAAQPVTDSLEHRLAKRARDNPRDLAAQLDLELFGLLCDEPSPRLASLATLPNEDKEVVAALVDGISNFRTGVRQDGNMLLSKKIRPLKDMADRLRTQAELAVPIVALCKRVDGFGKYEPIDPPRFPAGREHAVIVYCEIENFESQLNDKRLWETKLTQQVNLYTETGMLVWPDKPRHVSDECRNRRHDFFLYNLVKLPANLTIGRYLLKVSIEDRGVRHVAESTVPVEIVGQ